MNSPKSLQSPLLRARGFRHAFFTRHGGVSEGPYASLNFSTSTGDSVQNVRENLSRAAASLGIPPDRLYFLSQVHGAEAVLVESESGTEFRHRQGDAVVGVLPGIACGVRTADCVPILIADQASGAVAAVHAGWRGVAKGVVLSTLQCLRQALRAEGAFIAAIGPHISAAAFEVSEEVASELASAPGARDAIERHHGPKPHVVLRAIVRGQLESSGLKARDIDDVLGCTFLDADRFFSYRRDGRVGGRHLSVIVSRAQAAMR